ncbi:hypothetical protein V8C86DRAFT_1491673 [Haematococcus lacustris]
MASRPGLASLSACLPAAICVGGDSCPPLAAGCSGTRVLGRAHGQQQTAAPCVRPLTAAGSRGESCNSCCAGTPSGFVPLRMLNCLQLARSLAALLPVVVESVCNALNESGDSWSFISLLAWWLLLPQSVSRYAQRLWRLRCPVVGAEKRIAAMNAVHEVGASVKAPSFLTSLCQTPKQQCLNISSYSRDSDRTGLCWFLFCNEMISAARFDLCSPHYTKLVGTH